MRWGIREDARCLSRGEEGGSLGNFGRRRGAARFPRGKMGLDRWIGGEWTAWIAIWPRARGSWGRDPWGGVSWILIGWGWESEKWGVTRIVVRFSCAVIGWLVRCMDSGTQQLSLAFSEMLGPKA